MKRILMIATGGTIASRNTEEGLAPLFSSQEILDFLPQLKKICVVDSVELFSLDSTNISMEHWLAMAKTVEDNYDRYDGFVITHGTDTMAYSAAALSYLIQHSPKPIVFTGAQKPIDFDSSDARINLLDSFIYASSDDACNVSIVFSGNVIAGNRARKINTKSFQAFTSINYPYLAVVQDGRIIRYISQKKADRPLFCHQMSDRVGLFKLIPGVTGEYLRFYLEKNDAVIIESYGVGGLPMLSKYHFDEVIKWAGQNGKTIVLSTQVQNEGSDITVYQVGHYLKGQMNVLESYDMTTEAVVTKLMWILGQTSNRKEIARLFYKSVGNDILYHR